MRVNVKMFCFSSRSALTLLPEFFFLLSLQTELSRSNVAASRFNFVLGKKKKEHLWEQGDQGVFTLRSAITTHSLVNRIVFNSI